MAPNNFSTEAIEQAKRQAARCAISCLAKKHMILGVGSGTTIKYALEKVKELNNQLSYNIQCIPTSFQAKQLIIDQQLPMTDLNIQPSIDLAIDGADEVDKNLVAIKGGGACLMQEKIVAFAAMKFCVIADGRKNSETLGTSWTNGVPMEVLPMASTSVKIQLGKLLNVKQDTFTIRQGINKAGPVITDNGNFIIDWKFDKDLYSKYSSDDWLLLSRDIKGVPGILETGIFAKCIEASFFGAVDSGEVSINFGTHTKNLGKDELLWTPMEGF